MPTRTPDLFLVEDLEDVGRTSELAERDLDALHAVVGRRAGSPSIKIL
jgi:hypothetical protein